MNCTVYILYDFNYQNIKMCARLIYPDIDYLLLCSYCYGNNLCIQILFKITVNV